MVQAPEWWADPRPPTLPSLSGKDHPQKKPWQSRQARRLLERPGRGQGLQQTPPGGQDSPSRARTAPLSPGHWMALQAPREGEGTWVSWSRIKTRAQLLQTERRHTLCTTIYKTQPWVFRLRWCKTIVLLLLGQGIWLYLESQQIAKMVGSFTPPHKEPSCLS